jgi:hypothetical protein
MSSDYDYDVSHAKCRAVEAKHGPFLHSEWSIYDQVNFSKRAFDGEYIVAYADHWGDVEVVSKKIKNPTWLSLWKIADDLIHRSGDGHHVFIEGFHHDKKRPGSLLLSTGS